MSERESQPRSVVFLRHGKSEGNEAWEKAYDQQLTADQRNAFEQRIREVRQGEWVLVEAGREDARAAGPYLEKTYDVTELNASDFRRAIETAEETGLLAPDGPVRELVIRKELRDRADGDLDLKTGEERSQAFPEFAAAELKRPMTTPLPGGESVADSGRRYLDFVEEKRASMPDEAPVYSLENPAVVAVGHHEGIKGMLAAMAELSDEEYADSAGFRVANGMLVEVTPFEPKTGEHSETKYWVRFTDPKGGSDIPPGWYEGVRPAA